MLAVARSVLMAPRNGGSSVVSAPIVTWKVWVTGAGCVPVPSHTGSTLTVTSAVPATPTGAERYSVRSAPSGATVTELIVTLFSGLSLESVWTFSMLSRMLWPLVK